MVKFKQITLFLASLPLALLIWFVATLYPFNLSESDIIGLEGSPSTTVTLEPNMTLEQTFRVQDPLQISRVSVYSPELKLDGQSLELRIINETTHRESYSLRRSSRYQGNRLKLAFILNQNITASPGDVVTVKITAQDGSPLPLVAMTENVFPAGTMTVQDNLQPDLDLPITVSSPALLSPDARRGVMAGIIVLIGAAGISLISSRRLQWILAGLLFIIAAVFTLSGFGVADKNLGISDWDYYFTLHHDLRKIIADHHQPPLWNPYICGGTAGLADPESPLFTPTFLLELLFGVPVGLRLSIYLSTIVGGLGMLALARKLGLSPLAGLLAAIAAFLGTVNVLEIVEGHPNIFAAMWIPWIFWSWYSAYRAASQRSRGNFDAIARGEGIHSVSPAKQGEQRLRTWRQNFARLKASIWLGRTDTSRERLRTGTQTSPGKRKEGAGRRHTNLWVLLTGIFLALTFFQGGIYLLFYTGLAFLVLILMAKNRRRALHLTCFAILWAFSFAAIKLIPALLWLSQFQDAAYAGSTFTLPYLHEILLGRHLYGAQVLANQGSGWHEYGAYLGTTVIALALISLTRLRRQRIVRCLALAVFLALLLSSAGPLLEPIFNHISFIPRSTISRLVLFAVIPLSLLAGFGLEVIQNTIRRISVARVLGVILVGIAAVDILSLSAELSSQAFILPREIQTQTPAPEPIAFTTDTHRIRYHGIDYDRAYLSALAGYGTISYCTVLSPPINVALIGQEKNDYLTLDNSGADTAELLHWSPNKIHVQTRLQQPNVLILNTNYAAGWKVSSDTIRPTSQRVKNVAGRVGASLPAGTHDLTFTYRAPGLLFGLLLTSAAIFFALRRLWQSLALHQSKVR